jgi:hypothetical protein
MLGSIPYCMTVGEHWFNHAVACDCMLIEILTLLQLYDERLFRPHGDLSNITSYNYRNVMTPTIFHDMVMPLHDVGILVLMQFRRCFATNYQIHSIQHYESKDVLEDHLFLSFLTKCLLLL